MEEHSVADMEGLVLELAHSVEWMEGLAKGEGV